MSWQFGRRANCVKEALCCLCSLMDGNGGIKDRRDVPVY